MLFDLRSRGRRRAVQVIYGGLAVIMLGGLVLFGVGTGNNNGGFLNALTGNGSGGGVNTGSVVKPALEATRKDPSSASAWANLIQARFTAASEGSNFDSATNQYTASGKQQLRAEVQDWQRYLRLTKTPSTQTATLVAGSYGALADYAGEADAWQQIATAQPTVAKNFECLAASAYAAKETRVGSLAEARALTLVPKLQRATLKQTIEAAKTDPAIAQQC